MRGLTMAGAAGAAAVLLAAGCTGGTENVGADERPDPSAAQAGGSGGGTSALPAGGPGLRHLWTDVTETSLGSTGEWTNKVELADLEEDGDVDLLFANGGNYDAPGEAVRSRVFLNRGDATFSDATDQVFGGVRTYARVLKVADVNADGHQDVLMGTTYQTRSRLFVAQKRGNWREVTSSNLPGRKMSVGDLEVGDVDRDGDLDVVLADWGRGSPMKNRGGRTRLWLNDGSGVFTDVTAQRMPATKVQFSWELELVDVDNDWDLDVAVSCKRCPTSLLFENDGQGRFVDVSDRGLPATTNNYEFTPIDLDADGLLDLVTVNDGDMASYGYPEHVFHNTGGTFKDVTDTWWPPDQNDGWDDNVVVALDVESDGDADFLVGSLDGADRLLVNDGSGHLTVADEVFDAVPSEGTLGMAVADLNGDGRLDAVESQGEAPGFEDERVYLATKALARDTAPPVVVARLVGRDVVARVHDNLTPNAPHEWQEVTAWWDDGERSLTWYGENLFTAQVPSDAGGAEVCATDAAGNETCAPVETE